jgi:hypothetical protein
MNSLRLGNPKMMDEAVPANIRQGLAQEQIARGGWAYTAEQVKVLIGRRDVALVDLRETASASGMGKSRARCTCHTMTRRKTCRRMALCVCLLSASAPPWPCGVEEDAGLSAALGLEDGGRHARLVVLVLCKSASQTVP